MLKIRKISQGLHIGNNLLLVRAGTIRHDLTDIKVPMLRNNQENQFSTNSTMTPKNTDNSALCSITNYFENRSIFITGVTGFVGKVLVEKLLRSCTDIGDIYVLIRPSKGKSPQQRLQNLFDSRIFSVVRKEKPQLLEKVIPISGDITSHLLGISREDRLTIAEKVSVVFHSAASVDFHLPLHSALEMNLEGARNVMNMSQEMKNLSGIVYVSTAYSNAERNETPIEEIVYPPPFHPDTSLQFFSKLDELNILKSITPDLLGGKPNTYVFSKHLAEKWVELEAGKCNLPVCIVRPSIVAPIYNDPKELQGWMDNMNGIGVCLHGIVNGVSYISPGKPKIKFDVMPVDFVVKIMIVAAWETGMRAKALEDEGRIESCRVYNACIDHFNPITHGHFCELVLQGAMKTPTNNLIRPPSAKMTMRGWWEIVNFLGVGLTCIIVDYVAILLGQRRRKWKSFKVTTKGMRAVEYFKWTEFTFISSNVKNARAKIPDREKHIFGLDMEDMNWTEYCHSCALGFRRYFNKENDSTIPAAGKRLRRLRKLYYSIDACIVCGFTGLFIFAYCRL